MPIPCLQVEEVCVVTGGDVASVVAQRTVSAGTMGALTASVKNVLIGKVGRIDGQYL